MSSYCNLAIKTKKTDDKESQMVHLWSLSRNTEAYQFLNENNLASWSSEAEWGKIDIGQLTYALSNLQEEINKDQKRFSLMKELKTEDVNDILSWAEYIDDKIELKHKIEMLLSLVSEYAYNDVEGLYAYID